MITPPGVGTVPGDPPGAFEPPVFDVAPPVAPAVPPAEAVPPAPPTASFPSIWPPPSLAAAEHARGTQRKHGPSRRPRCRLEMMFAMAHLFLPAGARATADDRVVVGAPRSRRNQTVMAA